MPTTQFFKILETLQKLHLLLAPDKEHEMVFSDVPAIGFRNGKTLKIHRVRAALPNKTGRCEPCEKKTCLVCDSTRTTATFTTETCRETFKIQRGPLNCNSEKLTKFFKTKTKFRYRFSNYKSKHRAFSKGNRKIPQKRFHDHYCLDVI